MRALQVEQSIANQIRGRAPPKSLFGADLNLQDPTIQVEVELAKLALKFDLNRTELKSVCVCVWNFAPCLYLLDRRQLCDLGRL